MKTFVKFLVFATLLLVLAASAAMADPPSYYQQKFEQLPLNGVTLWNDMSGSYQTYWGHDEVSTAFKSPMSTTYSGTFMADDFADTINAPVAHVTWWGSYLNPSSTGHVNKFLISFESDIPAGGTYPFSYPGTPLLSQVVTLTGTGGTIPAGKFTEQFVSTGGTPNYEALYKYNAELALPFNQVPNQVAWLKIAALVNTSTAGQQPTDPVWGWHDRDFTVQDLLASTPPLVNPGEGIVANLFDPAKPEGVDVWHFQDDAVHGQLSVTVTGNNVLDLYQWNPYPTNYVYGLDGPYDIQYVSKDLAFALSAAPEPSTVAMLLGLALMGLSSWAWRRFRH